MKEILFVNIIILLVLNSCSSKTERIENKLMECNCLGFSDNGEQLKQLMSHYETYLIKEKIINDNSGESYRNIINSIANGNELKNKPAYSFVEQLNGIEKKEDSMSKKCVQRIISDSLKYDFIKFIKLQREMKNIINKSEDLKPESLASVILEVLSKKDFELDFYKFRTFCLLDMLDSKIEHTKVLPESNKNLDLDKAFRVLINSENKIFVNKKEIKLNDLKFYLIKYYEDNMSSSVVSIKTEKETKYSYYIVVENEIISAIYKVRDNYSKIRYGKKYMDLAEEKKGFLDKQYPRTLIIE